MSFNKGDKVIIRNGLKGSERYNGLYFNTGMEKYCGKTTTVTQITSDQGQTYYRLEADTGFWEWNDAMLMPASSKKTVVTVDGLSVDEVRRALNLYCRKNYTIDTTEVSRTVKDVMTDIHKRLNDFMKQGGHYDTTITQHDYCVVCYDRYHVMGVGVAKCSPGNTFDKEVVLL